MKLAVGDVVVYGPHGPGRIVARETKDVLGREQTVIVLALHDGLSIELPLARAQQSLRALADTSVLDEVRAILSTNVDGTGARDTWLKRRKDAQSKLAQPVGLAEIVRDAAARPQMAPSERDFARTARTLLAAEIALSRGIDTTEAEEWIDTQLTQPPATSL